MEKKLVKRTIDRGPIITWTLITDNQFQSKTALRLHKTAYLSFLQKLYLMKKTLLIPVLKVETGTVYNLSQLSSLGTKKLDHMLKLMVLHNQSYKEKKKKLSALYCNFYSLKIKCYC